MRGLQKNPPSPSGIRAALAFMSDNGILIQPRRLCAGRMRLDLGHLICSKMNFHFRDCTSGGEDATRETSEKCFILIMGSFIRGSTSHNLSLFLGGRKIYYQVYNFLRWKLQFHIALWYYGIWWETWIDVKKIKKVMQKQRFFLYPETWNFLGSSF